MLSVSRAGRSGGSREEPAATVSTTGPIFGPPPPFLRAPALRRMPGMRIAAGYLLATTAPGSPEEPLFLLLRDARHGTWSFPKGHLEAGETPLAGARRELEEETGIRDPERVPGFECVLEYELPPKGDRAPERKRVHLFLAHVPDRHLVLSEEHDAHRWATADEAGGCLAYDDLRVAVRRAREALLARGEDAPAPRTLNMPSERIEALIREIPDFPKPGIGFKDITPLLKDPTGLKLTLDAMSEQARELQAEVVAGPESRGFLFGMGVAARLDLGFVPIRKPGKLPYKIRSRSYDLEYGTDTVEVHEDAFEPGQKVILVDDLLATGGTMEASVQLVRDCGAEICGCLFLIELAFLNGRKRLPDLEVRSLLSYSE